MVGDHMGILGAVVLFFALISAPLLSAGKQASGAYPSRVTCNLSLQLSC